MTHAAGSPAAHRAGVVFAVIAAFGFSFKAILVKLAYPYGVDAVTLLALRMAFALPVFLWVGFTASRNAPALSWRDWLVVAALGALGYYGASILDFLGLKYISAGLERLILFTYPTLTLLFGVVLHGRAISRRSRWRPWRSLGRSMRWARRWACSARCCRYSPSRRRFAASAAGRRRWWAWLGRC